jgi:hypothetical protein
MIGTGSKYIKNVDDLLTLEGLRIIWERNVQKISSPVASKAAAKPIRSGAANPSHPRSPR